MPRCKFRKSYTRIHFFFLNSLLQPDRAKGRKLRGRSSLFQQKPHFAPASASHGLELSLIRQWHKKVLFWTKICKSAISARQNQPKWRARTKPRAGGSGFTRERWRMLSAPAQDAATTPWDGQRPPDTGSWEGNYPQNLSLTLEKPSKDPKTWHGEQVTPGALIPWQK